MSTNIKIASINHLFRKQIDRTDQSIAQNRFRASVLRGVDAISDQSLNVVNYLSMLDHLILHQHSSLTIQCNFKENK